MIRTVQRIDLPDDRSIDLDVLTGTPADRCDRCSTPGGVLRIGCATPRCELGQVLFCATCLRELANEVEA